ncbi:hypothetical protein P7K49_036360 [Saguinus oedipus]|uniref:Uncharacterized protein n=1 Tax=Saguinus oedipus TaxID=9490 RepID=A0ABQ9TKK7_SAGOE|nr:hypothetical protein P7K49_036360 [Saguinus oedipus]
MCLPTTGIGDADNLDSDPGTAHDLLTHVPVHFQISGFEKTADRTLLFSWRALSSPSLCHPESQKVKVALKDAALRGP